MHAHLLNHLYSENRVYLFTEMIRTITTVEDNKTRYRGTILLAGVPVWYVIARFAASRVWLHLYILHLQTSYYPRALGSSTSENLFPFVISLKPFLTQILAFEFANIYDIPVTACRTICFGLKCKFNSVSWMKMAKKIFLQQPTRLFGWNENCHNKVEFSRIHCDKNENRDGNE